MKNYTKVLNNDLIAKKYGFEVHYDDSDVFARVYHGVSALFDILVVRESSGGIYYGERGRLDAPCAGNCDARISECGCSGCQEAFDTERYSRKEIDRVLRVAFEYACLRRNNLCVVDKYDILESSRLWREAAEEISKDFPQVETSFLLIDKAVIRLIRSPAQFDVIVSSNLFGDILSSVLTALTERNVKMLSVGFSHQKK